MIHSSDALLLSMNMVKYMGKLCLAPMVRSGELPNRLMALHYGADLVWSPEYVDKKIIQTTRVVNDTINTIDYVEIRQQQQQSKKKKNVEPKPPSVVFRTHPTSEAGKLIFQLGSSDPSLAVQAASKVIADVDGIDLNCGCPKPFSTHSGMGAALLLTPDLLCSILTNLVQDIGKPNNKPISCKIRLLSDYETSHSLIEKICQTGISNLTIHCRTRDMRNRNNPQWQYLPRLIPFIQSHGISVIINGNLQSRLDFENMQRTFNNYDVGGMIAECAEANPSVFSHTLEPPASVVPRFLEYATKYNYDSISNSKFMILNQIPGKSPYYKQLCQLKSYPEFETLIQALLKDSDPLVLKIYLKDCQKQKLLTPLEYTEYMANRAKLMQQMLTEPLVQPINDKTINKRRRDSHDPLENKKTQHQPISI